MRIIYLPYYFLNTSSSEFFKLCRYVNKNYKLSMIQIIWDVLFCSLKFNMSFMDYFSFRFFAIDKALRSSYLGSGAMYEFQLKMNPKKYRQVLHNKIQFLQKFDDFSGRHWASVDMLKTNPSIADFFLGHKSGKFVLKYSKGQSGKEVKVCSTEDFNYTGLMDKMSKEKFDLIEEYLEQHETLHRLSPSAVNTVRIVTQVHNNGIKIVTCKLRVSVNSAVDNASVGNMVAPLDPLTGKVIGPAIYADITKADEHIHPVTGVELSTISIPFWNECIELVTKAAQRIPQNRSIGWDVAITKNKPVLIEGNHNWNYLIMQMPDKKGCKKEILQYAAN